MAQEEPAADFYCQCLAGVFIQDSQHPLAAPIAELVVDEIDAPDVVRMRRSQPDDRAVLVMQATLPLVPLWKLQPFLAPEALDRFRRFRGPTGGTFASNCGSRASRHIEGVA